MILNNKNSYLKKISNKMKYNYQQDQETKSTDYIKPNTISWKTTLWLLQIHQIMIKVKILNKNLNKNKMLWVEIHFWILKWLIHHHYLI